MSSRSKLPLDLTLSPALASEEVLLTANPVVSTRQTVLLLAAAQAFLHFALVDLDDVLKYSEMLDMDMTLSVVGVWGPENGPPLPHMLTLIVPLTTGTSSLKLPAGTLSR